MYLWTANISSNCTFAWYKFIKNEFNIDCQIGVELDSINGLYEKSGIYSAVLSELICIVSKYPKKIYRNEQKSLHNTKGPSVIWSNGGKLTEFDGYYINGRSIPKEIFDLCSSGKITRNDFIKERNEEKRAAIYEILGQESIMKLLDAKEVNRGTFVHADGELEEVVLYKTKDTFPELGNSSLAWVKFICPSTGTNYLIDVEPHHTDARKAAVSTSPLIETPEEYCWDERS